MEPTTNKYAMIFAGLSVSDEERFRVGKEIEKLGGLTFKITLSEEGWVAQCEQHEGIMAANSNPTPTDSEIQSEIRQAIIAAFNVEVNDAPVESPFSFEYNILAKKED